MRFRAPVGWTVATHVMSNVILKFMRDWILYFFLISRMCIHALINDRRNLLISQLIAVKDTVFNVFFKFIEYPFTKLKRKKDILVSIISYISFLVLFEKKI